MKVFSKVLMVILVIGLLVSCNSKEASKDIYENKSDNNNSEITKDSSAEAGDVEVSVEQPYYMTTETSKQGIDYSYISFDDMAPEGYELLQCWNGIGMDDEGRVYIGWTSMTKEDKEDFVLYRYDPVTKERLFIGTMMKASEAAGNLGEGEEIPKGHTEIIHVDGTMYLASQSFHDFKNEIDELPNYRGAHLYAYDIEDDVFKDISASLPGGVVVEHEGIVALSYKEDTKELLGLTHPHSSIVFFDTQTHEVNKVVDGIPWTLGNPLSREIIVDQQGLIYTYRGTESPPRKEEAFNMWIYDTNTEELYETDQMFDGGFWSGQVATKDGKTIYISTVNGKLFSLDTQTQTVEDLGYFIPVTMKLANIQPIYLYDITLSNDEKVIYALPPAEYGNLFKYTIEDKTVLQVTNLPDDIYSSNNLISEEGDLYFAKFKPWEGEARLMIIDMP